VRVARLTELELTIARYSGGRDGVICAWNLDLPLKDDSFDDSASATSVPPLSLPPGRRTDPETPRPARSTTLRHTVQAHTHWINDLVLTRGGEALVSASSDISVKIWRPTTFAGSPPQMIGQHSDYVKCLASPGPAINWVASGGLDKKVYLWDLSGGGEVLKINVGEEETGGDKGSVYALAATGSIVACGGPESVVRLWDARSGRRVNKFVGHTDNIRSVLLAQDGQTVISASSDQTVKLWSLTAGRCMYTLTMHNDSVWSLFSDHPTLGVFWSSDRSGIVAKTDIRGKAEVDNGLCVSVCQEGAGVNRVVAAGGYLWTATSSSSLNRWRDVQTENAEVLLPDSYAVHQRGSITTVTRARHLSGATQQSATDSPRYTSSANRNSIPPSTNLIPFRSVLRISNTAPFPERRFRDADTATMVSTQNAKRQSIILEPDYGTSAVPMRNRPDQTIEGQHGLMKHIMLNDKKRVLTLDTAGEVILWDILKVSISS
jgi:WD repeat-containing protein 48